MKLIYKVDYVGMERGVNTKTLNRRNYYEFLS